MDEEYNPEKESWNDYQQRIIRRIYGYEYG